MQNMKRLPLVASFVLFIALCASVAYWAMQLFKPPLRPVAAPPQTAQAEVRTEAAAGLFGGSAQRAAVASNYQLKGIIFSGSPRNSVAILSADGKPAQAVRVDMEVSPGVVVKEVHREYVLLSDNGTTKRVELPEAAKGQVELANLAPVPVQPAAAPSSAPPASQPGQPIPTRAQAAAAAAGQSNGTATPGQPPIPGTPPAASTGSPIPSGVVPSVQLPPTAPPTVVVSPPPGMPQSGPATAPSGAASTAAAAAAANGTPPQAAPPAMPAPDASAPAPAPAFPPRPSSEPAPLISR